MQLIASVTVSSVNNDQSVVEALCREFPAGRKGAGFAVELPLEGSTVQQLLAKLNQLRLTKRDYTRKGPRIRGEYAFDIRRSYDQEDFARAELLRMLHTAKVCEDQERDSEGRLILEGWRLHPALRMGCVLFEATVVSEEVRQQLVADGLRGVHFRELSLIPAREPRSLADASSGRVYRQVTREDQDHIEKRGKYWELTSTVTLPPIDGQRLIDRDSKPFAGDYSRGVYLKDEHRPPELHYRQSALRLAGPFDFALTFEKFPEEAWPVVSQRFRQFCLKHDLKLDWIPVRTDPE